MHGPKIILASGFKRGETKQVGANFCAYVSLHRSIEEYRYNPSDEECHGVKGNIERHCL